MADYATPIKPADVPKAMDSLHEEIKAYKADTDAKLAEKDAKIAELQTKAVPQYNVLSLDGKVYATARGPEEEQGRWGFADFGEFAREVKASRANGGPTPMIQKRFGSEYVQKAATGMGELVGSDGGFLVPPTFSNNIFERVYKKNDLLARTDQYTVAGNSMVFPRNLESSRATGSRWGGVQAYWTQEGSTITASQPRFGRLQLNLHKLACLARITDELMADSGPALGQYLDKTFGLEINFLVGNSLIRGTGAGQPLGILNAPATVTVSAEGGQGAATIMSANIAKMWARRFSMGTHGQYVWFINQDVGPQLFLLTLGIGTAGVVTYMPPGGLSAGPYATLMGAPVIETEWNSTLGQVGDIILADMSQVVSISKGGMQSLNSQHLYFATDEQAFRTTFRLDAQCWWASALTPFQGTNTQSPMITLAAR